MTVIATTLLALAFLLLIGHLILIFRNHPISFPSLKKQDLCNSVNDKTNILFVYPHPDDETFASGGLISEVCAQKNFNTFALTITKGELGDELLKLPPTKLGKVREKEYRSAVKTLGVKNYEVWNYPDGTICTKKQEIKSQLKDFITQHQITTVVTYERTGMYAHPDHICLSKIIYEISQETNIKPVYASLPKWIRAKIKLPKTIALNGEIIPLNSLTPDEPEKRIFTLRHALKKFKAMKAHESQNLPRGLRMYYYAIILSLFEYYSTTYDVKRKT